MAKKTVSFTSLELEQVFTLLLGLESMEYEEQLTIFGSGKAIAAAYRAQTKVARAIRGEERRG